MKRNKVLLAAVSVSLLILVGWAVTQVTVQGGASVGGLGLSTPSGGNVVMVQASTGTAAYNFNLPTSAGSSGTPLLSGGGGTAAMTYGTVTNNNGTTTFATGTFSSTDSGKGLTVDSHGNAGASGIVPNTTFTAAQNYMWLPTFGQPSSGGTGSANTPNVYFWIFNAPYYMSVKRMSVYVTTASNTHNFVVGVYDVTGTTLLGQATIPCGSTSGAAATATLVGAGTITLQPGTAYMLGWINDDSTCKVTSMAPPTFLAMINANSAVRLGTTTSVLTSGTLPAPIGAMTASTSVSTPIVVLEP